MKVYGIQDVLFGDGEIFVPFSCICASREQSLHMYTIRIQATQFLPIDHHPMQMLRSATFPIVPSMCIWSDTGEPTKKICFKSEM